MSKKVLTEECKIKQTYDSLLLNTKVTSTSGTTLKTYNSRKISDYDFLLFRMSVNQNSDYRGENIIPVGIFKIGNKHNFQSISNNGSSFSSAAFTYIDDTSINVYVNSSSQLISYVEVIGIKSNISI